MSKLTRKERKDKNRIYSKEFKLQTINNWLSKFKENGYNVIEKKKKE